MIGGPFKQMASDQTWLEIGTPLVPSCVEDYNRDPQVAETLGQLKVTGGYQRSDILMKAC